MARGDINEYYDPRHERQMAEMLKRSQALNQGTHLGGLASLLTQLHRGFRMQKDRKQRADTTKAIADAMNKSYKAPVKGSVEELVSNIDNASIMADPDEYPKLAEKLKNLSGTGVVSTESEMIDKDALKQQMGVYAHLEEGRATPTTARTWRDPADELAPQIDPSQAGGRTQLDNAFIGRDEVAAQKGYDPHRRALSNLLALGGDNPYASRMAAQMGIQQADAARAARIAAGIRDEKRTYTEGQKEIDFKRKSALELQKYLRGLSDKRNLADYTQQLKSGADLKKDYGKFVRDHYKAWRDTGYKAPAPMSFDQWNSASSGAMPGQNPPVAAAASGSAPNVPASQVPRTLAEAQAAKTLSQETVKKQVARRSKELEAMPGRRARIMSQINRLPILRKNIADAKKLAGGWFTSGLPGQLLAPFGFSDQFELNQVASQIQSAVGLKELVAIKEQGGTFGALSEKELELLINTVGSLNTIRNGQKFSDTLDDVDRLFQKTLVQDKAAFKTMYPDEKVPWDKQGTKKTMSSQDIQALDWAKKNSSDPRAQEIMRRLGWNG